MRNWSRFSFFIVAVVWGASFAFQRQLLPYINPYTFTFWNFLVSGLIMLGVVIYKRQPLLYRLREGIVLGILLSAYELFQMVGLQLTTAADTAFISNLGMILIPYAGWLLFNHRVSIEHNIALVLAGVGMYFLVGGIDEFMFGDLVLIASAVGMALYFLFSQRYEGEKRAHVTTLLAQQFLTTAACCGVVVLVDSLKFSVPAQVVPEFILQIILFTTLPYIVIQWASRWADELIPAFYDGVVEPLVGGMVAWVFFAEPASQTNVIGGLLMVVAFALAALFSSRHFLDKKMRAIVNLVR